MHLCGGAEASPGARELHRREGGSHLEGLLPAVAWHQRVGLPDTLRDYKQEIEAAVAAKLSTWKLEHLQLWADLVSQEANVVQVHTAQELMEMEDEAQAARFREIRAKLAEDVSQMTAFNATVEEGQRRAHVIRVMHEKSQMEKGKELLI